MDVSFVEKNNHVRHEILERNLAVDVTSARLPRANHGCLYAPVRVALRYALDCIVHLHLKG